MIVGLKSYDYDRVSKMGVDNSSGGDMARTLDFCNCSSRYYYLLSYCLA